MASQKSRTEGSQKVRADLSEDQLNAAVIHVTSFLLCEMRCKRKIRKEDVVANALNKSARQYSLIMQRVEENLKNIYGLQISKLPNNEESFIIVNKHQKMFIDLTQELTSSEELEDNMILSLVLSSIFMNRGQMFEAHLMSILEITGCFKTNFYDSARLKNAKDHITKLLKNVFVKQMYLETNTVPRPKQKQNPPLPEEENNVTVFRWGFRALLEVDVDSIDNFIKQIHDGNRPPGFPCEYFNELKKKQEELKQN